MFETFLYTLFLLILFIPFSHFLKGTFEPSLYSFSKQLIFATIVLSFLSMILNFFFPLNKLVNSIILIFSILILFKKREIYFTKKFAFFLILQALLISILITESNVYRPDAGLYHLPYIGILNSEKIILGLSNLHFRYGHSSILQYLAAISNNFLIKDPGIVFAPAIIAVSVIINFTYLIYISILKKNYNFHFYFLFFVFIYISYKMNRYSEYGTDAPAHFLFFFLISELILFFKKANNDIIINNLILTLFIIQNKIFLLPVLIFNYFSISKINYKTLIFEKNFYFLTIFFLIWLLNNALTTGCLLFPVSITCFEMLPWTDLKVVNEQAINGEIWSKGWSSLSEKMKEEIGGPLNFKNNFNWLNIWTKTHFLIILKILAPYIVFIILIIIFFIYNSKKNLRIVNNETDNTRYEKYFIVFAFVGFLFWFLKAPIYRYGYSFIISFVSLYSAYFLSSKIINKKVITTTAIAILFIGYSVIFFKNQLRINNSKNTYNNYPWPKYLSMDETNELTDFEIVDLKYKKIYVPQNGYCMYTQNICSHYQVDSNLRINKIGYYYYFYNNLLENK